MEGLEEQVILLRTSDVVPGENGRRNRAYSKIKRTKSARINARRKDAGLIPRDFSMRHKHKMISLSGRDRVGSDSSNSVSLANGEVVSAGDRTPPMSPSSEPPVSPLSGGGEEEHTVDSNKREEVLDAEPSVRCSRCSQMIADSTAIQFEDNLYHTSCFKCAQCKNVVELTGQQMLVLDGSPLCMACSPTCWNCKDKITESHMKVLDQDFHEDCLKCVRCNKPLKDCLKIYASDKSPCCAACTLPVFERLVPSPRPPPRARMEYHSFHQHGRISIAVDSCTPPSRSVTPDPSMLKRLSRSDPTLDHLDTSPHSSVSSVCRTPCRGHQEHASISASSLPAILHDELGLSLLINYCTREYCIELLMLWLDVEHFRGFDGDQEDLTLMAQHLVLKYIAYAADMPVCLPQAIERRILTAIENKATPDMFDEAQRYVFGIMEETIHKRFLFSDDGLKYLESLVRRDIEKRRRSRDILSSDFTESQLKAVVTNFDKRHAGSKFYVYQINVTMADEEYTIYRRYSEFHSMHQKLRSSFPRHRLPSLPRKILFGRSQVRAVAQQRMTELQRYLKELLLQMPPQIATSTALLMFLQQTPSDMEDEMFDKKVQRNSVQGL